MGLFFSDQPKHLANLPTDPVAMLGGLDKQYSVALRFFVQNVPQNLRDLALFQLHNKIDVDMKGVKLDDPEIDGAFLESVRQEAEGIAQRADQPVRSGHDRLGRG